MECHRGHLFHISGSPAPGETADALVHHPDGAVLVDDDGRVTWSGAWRDRPAVDATVVDHHGAFLLPGLVDTHLHFPQVYCTDAYGGGSLLHWLERVVFPAEARFADPRHAAEAAAGFCDRLVGVGTTTSLVFGSQFPVAQDALFAAARARGLRMVSGRTLMTVGPAAAAPLLTGERDAVDLAVAEIERWHEAPGDPEGRLRVALVPRFALSVTTDTLAALGELYEEMRGRGVYVTTHLSENATPGDGEVDSVRAAFGVDAYLDVYDGRFLPGSRRGGASLLGRRSVFAHAVHCSDEELRRLAAAGSAVAHCPVSQQFLGSGTMPWARVLRSGVTVGIGSDVAAGDEWFLPRVLNACFKAHMNDDAGRTALEPADLLHAATLGGATALDLQGEVGNLDPGKYADLVVLDPGRCPPLSLALEHRTPLDDEREETSALLFLLLMAADERAVVDTWIGGRRVGPVVGESVGVGRG